MPRPESIRGRSLAAFACRYWSGVRPGGFQSLGLGRMRRLKTLLAGLALACCALEVSAQAMTVRLDSCRFADAGGEEKDVPPDEVPAGRVSCVFTQDGKTHDLNILPGSQRQLTAPLAGSTVRFVPLEARNGIFGGRIYSAASVISVVPTRDRPLITVGRMDRDSADVAVNNGPMRALRVGWTSQEGLRLLAVDPQLGADVEFEGRRWRVRGTAVTVLGPAAPVAPSSASTSHPGADDPKVPGRHFRP